jgi:hypothetical protein
MVVKTRTSPWLTILRRGLKFKQMRDFTPVTRACLFLTFILCSRGFASQEPAVSKPATPREILEQLNKIAIDPAQIYLLHGVQITRDGVNFYFNRGFIGFLEKVDGEITGAVFSGDGEVLLIPPNFTEKASLAQFTQAPVLEEKFNFAYLRFTDSTARELLAAARHPGQDDDEQPTGFAERWAPIVRQLDPIFSLRILEDLLGDRKHPYFHTQLQGVELGVFAVSADERSPEAVTVGAARPSQGTVFADIWCSYPSRSSEAHARELMTGSVRVHSYKIDTQIDPDNSLEGHAELELESMSSGEHILILNLSSRLRVSEVRDEQGEKIDNFQAPPPDSEETPMAGDNWLALALPTPYPAGARFRLSFTYQGNVIDDMGHGVLYVGERGSWYPNRGPFDRASYDLTFRYPAQLTLVATGDREEETTTGDVKKSHWVSHGEFPVAGFNLGPYDSRLRQVGKTAIEVYATPEAEAALEKRHAVAQTGKATVAVERGTGRAILIPDITLAQPLTPIALLDQVAERASQSVKYFETLFGPYPYSRLAIAQIPGHAGQGWPELVYLPTLSFLEQSERAELGLQGKSGEYTDQVIVAHEIAHQWWGNEVGWQTHHDQWLSEGFASYSALLYLGQEKDGDRKVREVLRGYKQDLMAKTPEGHTVESGGPIWLGQRLTNSLNPNGYNDIVYKKACWVLHMLHVLMTDPATGSDARFFKMLREFIIAYRGASPSTEDFMRHAEKYMTSPMDLDRNHHLQWFFDDWVYATGIPTYKLEFTSRRLAADKYAVQGTIEQSGVPAGFQMLVPVVATFNREKKVTLGLVPVSETGGRFKFTTKGRPAHLAIDENDLLAVVR